MGSEVMALTEEGRSALRSITCVAPRDLRRSVLLREAVVMIGLKPDSFASWMAMFGRVNENARVCARAMRRRTLLAYCGSTASNQDRLTGVLSTSTFIPGSSELGTAELASGDLATVQAESSCGEGEGNR